MAGLPTTMPFGKHKGTPLSQLPDDYIKFLLNDFEGLRDPLRHALEAVVAKREGGAGATPPSRPAPSAPRDPMREGSHPQEAAASRGVSTTDDRLKRIVNRELATIFRRIAKALEKENP